MITEVFVPSMHADAQVTSDGVGCSVTVGRSDNLNSQTVILSLSDRMQGGAYALLDPERAREIARFLNELADRAEAGEAL